LKYSREKRKLLRINHFRTELVTPDVGACAMRFETLVYPEFG
jgi:hypothetical protein